MNWNQKDSEAEIEHLRKRIGVIKHNRNELFDETVKLQAENDQMIKFLEDALPHITCESDSQSGLITAIGTFLQALKDE